MHFMVVCICTINYREGSNRAGNQHILRKTGCLLVLKAEHDRGWERHGMPEMIFLFVNQGEGHKSHLHVKSNWLNLVYICMDCSVCDAGGNLDSYHSHRYLISHLCLTTLSSCIHWET